MKTKKTYDTLPEINTRIEDIRAALAHCENFDTEYAVNLQGELTDLEIKQTLLETKGSPTKININNTNYYKYKGDAEMFERTKKRLNQLIEMGMEDVGVAEFGVRGVVSGMYVERVWSYDEQQWNSYIKWADMLIKRKRRSS
jgi:hypothetical protein